MLFVATGIDSCSSICIVPPLNVILVSHFFNTHTAQFSKAECEAVANNIPTTQPEPIHDDDASVGRNNNSQNKNTIEIRGDHIVKIAAELLMDYS